MPNYKTKTKAPKNNMAAQQKKKKYTTVKNEDGTETNTRVKRRKIGKRKGEVKSTTTSLVGTTPSGEKVGLASIKSKPGKEDKTSGNKKALADLKKSKAKKDELAATAPSKQTESQKNKLPKKLVGIIAAKAEKSSAAKQRGKANLMKQNAIVQSSKNRASSAPKPKAPKPKKKKKVDLVATKKGKVKSTASISKANLILKPNIDVFKNIDTNSVNSKYNFKMEKEGKSPEMAVQMKGYHPGKMSDTDMGIEERFGKQATSDVLAAQQQGNPIMPNFIKEKHTDSGMNYRDANNASIKGTTVDEGHLSNVKTKSPYRPYVETEQTSNVPMRPNSAALPGGGEPGEKLFLDKAAKMYAPHPSKQRMSNMINKVAQYKMPNVKAAQKKYHK